MEMARSLTKIYVWQMFSDGALDCGRQPQANTARRVIDFDFRSVLSGLEPERVKQAEEYMAGLEQKLVAGARL